METNIQNEISKKFIDEFTKEYSKKKDWYRFGKMSGKIIFERQMNGNIAEFVQGLKNSQNFYEVFIREKSQDKPLQLDFSSAIRLWEYAFDSHVNEIKQAILKEHDLESSLKTPELTTKTYHFEGKEVVFLSFYQACYGEEEYYAVPKDVALALCLEDYDNHDMSRWDELWEQLEQYKIKEEFMFKGTCIKTYNYD